MYRYTKEAEALVIYTLLKLQFNVVFQLQGHIHSVMDSGAEIRVRIGMAWAIMIE